MRLEKATLGTSADVGRVTAEAVLRVLLSSGPMGRAGIAEHIGVGRPTVSRVTGRLMDIELLREGEPIRSNLGRPVIPLEISSTRRVVGTIHFGSSQLRIGLVDPLGRVLVERRYPYQAADIESAVEFAAARLEETVATESHDRKVLGVGASIGGWVDPDSGQVLRFAPRAWYDIPLAQLLEGAVDYPLLFDHTIRGAALAERMFGAARGVEDFLELWVGDVIGAAIVTDGVIRRGPQGGAGVAAHLPLRNGSERPCGCGRVGCLQAVASDDAVVEIARDRGVLTGEDTMADLVLKAQTGHADAIRLIVETADLLAAGFASAVDLFNPSMVVVGGLITEAPQFFEAYRSALIRETDRFVGGEERVALSKFGDLGPTIATASLVLDAFYRDPLGIDVAADRLALTSPRRGSTGTARPRRSA